MNHTPITRSELPALADCVREHESFERLTTAEARTMRALAAQIIPINDDVPATEHAALVRFVDHALGLPSFANSVPIVRAGLADLDARANLIDPRVPSFASLSTPQQAALIQELVNEPFFRAARALVMIGTFADPSFGASRGRAPWAMVGVEHRATLHGIDEARP